MIFPFTKAMDYQVDRQFRKDPSKPWVGRWNPPSPSGRKKFLPAFQTMALHRPNRQRVAALSDFFSSSPNATTGCTA
jgi:hypothetical protein